MYLNIGNKEQAQLGSLNVIFKEDKNRSKKGNVENKNNWYRLYK